MNYPRLTARQAKKVLTEIVIVLCIVKPQIVKFFWMKKKAKIMK